MDAHSCSGTLIGSAAHEQRGLHSDTSTGLRGAGQNSARWIRICCQFRNVSVVKAVKRSQKTPRLCLFLVPRRGIVESQGPTKLKWSPKKVHKSSSAAEEKSTIDPGKDYVQATTVQGLPHSSSGTHHWNDRPSIYFLFSLDAQLGVRNRNQPVPTRCVHRASDCDAVQTGAPCVWSAGDALCAEPAQESTVRAPCTARKEACEPLKTGGGAWIPYEQTSRASQMGKAPPWTIEPCRVRPHNSARLFTTGALPTPPPKVVCDASRLPSPPNAQFSHVEDETGAGSTGRVQHNPRGSRCSRKQTSRDLRTNTPVDWRNTTPGRRHAPVPTRHRSVRLSDLPLSISDVECWHGYLERREL